MEQRCRASNHSDDRENHEKNTIRMRETIVKELFLVRYPPPNNEEPHHPHKPDASTNISSIERGRQSELRNSVLDFFQMAV